MASHYDTNTTAQALVEDLRDHIKGKVVLVTGVTLGGIGGNFVKFIAPAQPGLLILAGRSQEKLKLVTDELAPYGIESKLLEVDLASSSSVKDAASAINKWSDVPHIDVVVNNAGIMAVEYATTSEGWEKQWAVNYLTPWLFTNLIMKKVLASQNGRIVNVTSDGHRLSGIRWGDIDFHKGENYNKWRAYGQSKTAQILMSISLAQKLGDKGLTAVSLHPGVVGGTSLGTHINWKTEYQDLADIDKQLGNWTGWLTRFDYKSSERGAATHVYAAFHPELQKHNGAYLNDSHIADYKVDTIKAWATSPVEAAMLWELSEKQLGVKFDY